MEQQYPLALCDTTANLSYWISSQCFIPFDLFLNLQIQLINCYSEKEVGFYS